MLSIVLCQKGSRKAIAWAQQEGNERFLVGRGREFTLLSQLDPDESSSIGPERMRDLMEELARVRAELSDDRDKKHLDEIQRLAIRCLNDPDSFLAFTPHFERRQ